MSKKKVKSACGNIDNIFNLKLILIMKKFFLVAAIALVLSSCNGFIKSTQDTNMVDSTAQEVVVVDSLTVDTVAVDTVATEVVAE